MNRAAWVDEVQRRIAIDEGCSVMMYLDSADPPNPTIGIGFNLNRSDARAALLASGVPLEAVEAVIAGTQPMTQSEVTKLFAYSFAPIESEARESLSPGIFDALTDARRFVICDLIYNLGDAGWNAFAETQALIDAAQIAKNAGDGPTASHLFGRAADHLEASLWYSEVGDRAKRDVAMLRNSTWVNATGDGSW